MQGESKTCLSCLRDLPLAAFGRNSRSKDGLYYYCRACHSARQRDYVRRNPEKVAEAKRRWAEARTTEDRAREYRRAVERHGREALQAKWYAWLEVNREAVVAYNKAWRHANPAAATKHARRYRHGNPNVRQRINERKPGRRCEQTADYAAVVLIDPCSYCGEQSTTVDHIIPLAAAGENHWTNYTGACLACNGGKRDRPLLTFLLARHR